MKDGIYFVTFKSNLHEYGEATIVVRDGVVNGGNYVCSYCGKVVNNVLSLSVKKYNQDTRHVFGDEEQYRLLFVIKEDGENYFLLGEMLDNPDKSMEAKAKFIGDILY
ncbi:hypothetical protein PROVRETT_10087 [Providencia rettgeri DSM 1131]|uniref:GrlR family regulatory protein n=1 Tax=Providencia rettgeri TaxID=587 RepID=UPI000197C17F|nr:GrlR family regulatory protein [Providencia rettgeri]EFE51262.1 hypothetical protein PROVRETT_10087 [Providencia rettgeri DSM 1131]QXA58844.1 hypothetical protein I6L79_04610 [Providencia rettgeri]